MGHEVHSKLGNYIWSIHVGLLPHSLPELAGLFAIPEPSQEGFFSKVWSIPNLYPLLYTKLVSIWQFCIDKGQVVSRGDKRAQLSTCEGDIIGICKTHLGFCQGMDSNE